MIAAGGIYDAETGSEPAGVQAKRVCKRMIVLLLHLFGGISLNSVRHKFNCCLQSRRPGDFKVSVPGPLAGSDDEIALDDGRSLGAGQRSRNEIYDQHALSGFFDRLARNFHVPQVRRHCSPE